MRSAPIITLILAGLLLFSITTAAQIDQIPAQLLIRVQHNVEVKETSGGYATDIENIDKAMAEFRIETVEKPFSADRSSFPFKDRVLLIRITDKDDLERLRARLETVPEIDWVCKHLVHSLEFVPDDSLFAEQYYLPQVKAPEAWDLAENAEPVIIGIIDSGVEYTHPDLAPKIWINPYEDQPPFGILDSADYNGIDDDDNGYIDDLVGWDFVDSPNLPFGSDFLDTDNDPMDTFGHGTAVAGIAAAAGNNGFGIAGAASNALIMPLRCASSLYLTELAAAKAMIYAIDPYPQNPSLSGAKVINMSFGTADYSPLMQDIIDYAVSQNVVLVASAGNSGSTAPHYPSGYDNVISVGAVNSYDQVLGVSNYGSFLDIVAPGQELISTVPDGDYDKFWGGTGTSFSAPLVSAAAAMVFGNNSELNSIEVRSIIFSAADDLYQAGWDSLSGHGRLNMEQALLIDDPIVAQIESPETASGFAGDTLQISGSAYGYNYHGYSLDWGYGYNPDLWHSIQSFDQRQVVGGLLGYLVFDSTYIDTTYTLKMTVWDNFGSSIVEQVFVDYFTEGPEITGIEVMTALDGDEYASLVSFKTDQFSTVKLRMTGPGPVKEMEFNFPDTSHLYIVPQSLIESVYNLQIYAFNSAGLQTSTEIIQDVIILNQAPYNAGYYIFKDSGVLPNGHLLPKTYDFDLDSKPEVFLNEYTADGYYDTLKHFEYDGGIFTPTGNSYGNTIPQDIGDSDADGRIELMARSFGSTYIFEQLAAGQVPNSLIYLDSTDSYGSRLLDLDGSDQQGEIFARKDQLFQILSHADGGSTELLAEIDPEGMGLLGIPRSEWADFNDDGQIEVLFGDGSGQIFVYTMKADNIFEEVFRDTLPFGDVRDYLGAGDFDGDGVSEFIAGCHAPIEYVEVGTDLSYWVFYIYNYTNGSFNRADTLYFAGASDPSTFDAGISTGDSDSDGTDEIFLSIYPHLYQVRCENGEYAVSWHYEPCRSNQVLIEDLDGNGLPELIFNRGDGFTAFEAPSAGNLPLPPMLFTVKPVNTSSIRLAWEPVANIQYYQISRGTSPDSLIDVFAVIAPDTSAVETNLTENVEYYYAVSTYINGQYSPYSAIKSAIPNTPPELVDPGPSPTNPFHMRLKFSEPMGLPAADVFNYQVTPGIGNPSSVLVEENASFVRLMFSKPFASGISYQLTLGEIPDAQNTPLAFTGPFSFTAPNYPQTAPYLVKGTIIPSAVLLEFSTTMDPDSAEIAANYSIIYGEQSHVDIISAEPDTLDFKYVKLTIYQHTPMGALGNIYEVSAAGLYSVAGVPLDPDHSQITVTMTSRNLDKVFAYPNPYRAGTLTDGESCVVFANLTSSASIRIFNFSGELVKKLENDLTFGGIKWYLDNENGDKVGNGVYIYYVEGEGDSFTGKVAVMR